MLLVFPFHAGDQDQALQLAQWIAELGTVQSHQCLIVHDKHTDPQTAQDIENTLGGAFRHVVRMPLRESALGIKGMNLLFRRVVRQVQASQAGSFLWLNPDAVPLREGWLDAIEAAAKTLPRGKVFLGCHLQGAIPHMAAVGVYPQDAETKAPNLVMADNNPFNLNAAPQVVPQMAHTELIVDSHLEPFDLTEAGESVMSPLAVLWHGSMGCRSGALLAKIQELPREMLAPLEIVAPAAERAERAPGTFAVPAEPIRTDKAAREAVSKAGSEGIPSEEIETETTVPSVRVPTVNPVKVASEPERKPLKMSGRMVTVEPPPPLPNKDELTNAMVRELADLLAFYRDKSPAHKAHVLGSLRAAGFPITGKLSNAQKGGGK